MVHGQQYKRMGYGSSLLCDIISGFHSNTKQAQTEREIAFFLTECLIRVLFLDITPKVTQEMAELCTEYPPLTITAQSE